MKKNATLLVVILLVVGGGWWVWRQLSKPLAGQAVPDMGRQHVADISNVAYNSNPPTSGPHFALWLKAGVYDRAVSDGYFMHSMEHGYVVISYDCTKSFSISHFPFSIIYAHETEEPHEEPATTSAKPLTRMQAPPSATRSWFTPEDPPAKEIELPESFSSTKCKALVDKLRGFVGGKRVVVVPRLANDTLVALTAWNRIDKMDSLDEARIRGFIDAWNNRGPEKTIE